MPSPVPSTRCLIFPIPTQGPTFWISRPARCSSSDVDGLLPAGLLSNGVPMSETKQYSYETRLNVLYPPLETIDAKALADACEFKWYNQTLCQVNESVVRLGVLKVSITGTSTMLMTSSSTLSMANYSLILKTVPSRSILDKAFVVPQRVVHRTRAPRRTVVLMVENKGILPTGDPRGIEISSSDISSCAACPLRSTPPRSRSVCPESPGVLRRRSTPRTPACSWG